MPEQQSPAKLPPLAHPMRVLTALVLRRPLTTLAAAGVLTLASVILAATGLGYKTSRTDLLDPNSDYNRLWLDFLAEFGDQDDAVVVLEGPGPDEVIAAADLLSERIRRESRHFHSVLDAVDLQRLRSKGLYYLPPAELQHIDSMVAQATPILDGQWTRLQASNMLGGLNAAIHSAPDPATQRAARQQLAAYLSSLESALAPQPAFRSPWLTEEGSADLAPLENLGKQYLLANEGRLGFILLHLERGQDDFAQNSEAIDQLRRVLDGAQRQLQPLGVTAGLTGLPVMENDEMRSSQSSMLWASSISFVGVALIFIAGFGGVRHALLANIVLLVGMAWAFGWVTLSVGHLNILSVSFAVTLIGIGIDYGVYYVARYMKTRDKIASPEEALLETTSAVGPAIATGAITTAIAFFAAGFTSFAGVAELGIIAGGGIILCALAQLFVLPALILVVDRSAMATRMPRPLPAHRMIVPLLRRSGRLLAVGGVAVLLISSGIGHLWYDHNLLNMQAEGLESVELEKKLLTESDQNTWYAVSVADTPEELLAKKAQFESLSSVARTEDILSLFPADISARQPIIERIHQRLQDLPTDVPEIPVDALSDLHAVFTRVYAGLQQEQDVHLAALLERIGHRLGEMTQQQCIERLARFQAQSAQSLLGQMHLLKSVSDPRPPSRDDLPTALVDRFIGNSGKHLLKVYGRGDIWDMDRLTAFVTDVRSVDPRVTGHPLQAYEASHEMKGSFEEAAAYALIIILVVLLFDFRSIRYSLLAMLPLSVGVASTFGIMGWLNIPLNPANMIALPLMLGIAVDYGVHIVHEFREQTGRYQLSPATTIAVLVDALTTIVGFGSLMIASHQGLQSLGRVLTIGIACCTVTSMLLLPALMTWMTGHSPGPGSSAGGVDTEGSESDSNDVADEVVVPRHVHLDPRAA